MDPSSSAPYPEYLEFVRYNQYQQPPHQPHYSHLQQQPQHQQHQQSPLPQPQLLQQQQQQQQMQQQAPLSQQYSYQQPPLSTSQYPTTQYQDYSSSTTFQFPNVYTHGQNSNPSGIQLGGSQPLSTPSTTAGSNRHNSVSVDPLQSDNYYQQQPQYVTLPTTVSSTTAYNNNYIIASNDSNAPQLPTLQYPQSSTVAPLPTPPHSISKPTVSYGYNHERVPSLASTDVYYPQNHYHPSQLSNTVPPDSQIKEVPRLHSLPSEPYLLHQHHLHHHQQQPPSMMPLGTGSAVGVEQIRRHTIPPTKKRNSKVIKKNRCCNICQKIFNRPSGLKIHMYSHTGEKPFRCAWDNCGKFFSVRSNMIRHHKIHLRKHAQMKSKEKIPNIEQHMNGNYSGNTATTNESEEEDEEEENIGSLGEN